MRKFQLLAVLCSVFQNFHVISVDISLQDICGNKLVGTCPDRINVKVVGGQSSCAEKVPWNVLIELVSGPKLTASDGAVYPYCGGVLITSKHILSAAHCFWTNENPFGSCPRQFLELDHAQCQRQECPASCSRIGPEDIRVHLGASRRSQIVQGAGEKIERIVIHPGWDRTSKLNDILAGHDLSVLVLKEEVDMYNIKTIPICLPNPAKDRFLTRQGRAADVTGFGLITNPRNGGRKHPDVVQTASVTIVDRESCQSQWSITGTQICAAGNQNIIIENTSKEIVSDSCNGDSGGGLTASNVDGREVILGIVSFGEPDCGRVGGKPGVYTNVVDHMKWIKEMISDKNVEESQKIDPSADSENKNDQLFGPGIGLKCLSTNGKFCKFPFKFQGRVFASCTTEFDPENRAWCSTKVDSRGVHISGKGEFGYCPETCQSNILTTPNPPTLGGGGGVIGGWSSWSPCSASCGGGIRIRKNEDCPPNRTGCASEQTRQCNTQSCPPSPSSSPSSPSSSSWTSWSTCTKSCGVGTQIRKRKGTNIAVTRGCNIFPCQSASTTGSSSVGRPSSSPSLSSSSSSGRRPPSDSFQDNSSVAWIVGGSSATTGGSVESLVSLPDGRLCGRELQPLPIDVSAPSAGFIGDQVLVCGGEIGSNNIQNSCFSQQIQVGSGSRGWVRSESLLVNTTNAAAAVADGRFYVFGGSRSPHCDPRPEVQIYNPISAKWKFLASSPPTPLGGFNCAVTAGNYIFVIGGYSNRLDHGERCKESLSPAERREEKNILENHQSKVQVLNTETGVWSQGPTLKVRRKNHGCTLVDVAGTYGIMVAGGYNSQEGFLNSVEYLSLGSNLEQIESKKKLQWRFLPEMKHSIANSLMLVNSKNFVLAVGGGLSQSEMNIIEKFDKKKSRWFIHNYKTKKKRNFAAVVQNIKNFNIKC